MRFVTFLGLIMIAKCIDPVRIADATSVIMTILGIAALVDIIDCVKRWTK